MHLKGDGLVSGVLDIYGQEMAPTCQQCAAELQYVQVQFKKSFFHNNNVVVSFYLGVHVRAASYQLFTCKRVRFVCAAICLFSSSVGYGC